tara:strand:+ start:212 stop:505 length:294 start_codon:yes stop_codon:yes gene_type:complete
MDKKDSDLIWESYIKEGIDDDEIWDPAEDPGVGEWSHDANIPELVRHVYRLTDQYITLHGLDVADDPEGDAIIRKSLIEVAEIMEAMIERDAEGEEF